VAAKDPGLTRTSSAGYEAEMAERRGRRLSLSCRVGMTLRLSLFLHNLKWPLRIDEAWVRWVNGGMFGLEFTGIRPAQRERVRAIIMKAKL